MSFEQKDNNDPLAFVRNLWGNMGFSLPGMVAPTFDLDELDKRITDMKAVEGWLRMNLSMLQMTIQSLEMQRTTVSAVQAMGKMAKDAVDQVAEGNGNAEEGAAGSAFSEAAMWPWQMMQQMREHMQQAGEAAAAAAAAEPPAEEAKPAPAKPKTTRRPAAKK
jgi:hypothetical protein